MSRSKTSANLMKMLAYQAEKKKKPKRGQELMKQMEQSIALDKMKRRIKKGTSQGMKQMEQSIASEKAGKLRAKLLKELLDIEEVVLRDLYNLEMAGSGLYGGAMEKEEAIKLLELPENYTKDDVERNFKKLKFKYHPDRNEGTTTNLFYELNEAYKVVNNEETEQEDITIPYLNKLYRSNKFKPFIKISFRDEDVIEFMNRARLKPKKFDKLKRYIDNQFLYYLTNNNFDHKNIERFNKNIKKYYKIYVKQYIGTEEEGEIGDDERLAIMGDVYHDTINDLVQHMKSEDDDIFLNYIKFLETTIDVKDWANLNNWYIELPDKDYQILSTPKTNKDDSILKLEKKEYPRLKNISKKEEDKQLSISMLQLLIEYNRMLLNKYDAVILKKKDELKEKYLSLPSANDKIARLKLAYSNMTLDNLLDLDAKIKGLKDKPEPKPRRKRRTDEYKEALEPKPRRERRTDEYKEALEPKPRRKRRTDEYKEALEPKPRRKRRTAFCKKVREYCGY